MLGLAAEGTEQVTIQGDVELQVQPLLSHRSVTCATFPSLYTMSHDFNSTKYEPIFNILSLTNFKPILYVPITDIFTSYKLNLSLYTTLQHLIVQNYQQSFNHTVKISLF